MNLLKTILLIIKASFKVLKLAVQKKLHFFFFFFMAEIEKPCQRFLFMILNKNL